MDHATAVETKIAEKYLLGELTAAQENEFAEHFFDCEACANDVRTTSLFLETAKKVLAEDRGRKPSETAKSTAKWWSGGWQSARYAMAASVALFAFTLYQNTVTIPSLRQAMAPQALEYYSLTTMGSRGADQTVITPASGRPFILLVDLQAQANATEYRVQVVSAQGAEAVSVNVSAATASKQVPLLIPSSALKPGSYFLVFSSKNDIGSFTEFDRQPLQVK